MRSLLFVPGDRPAMIEKAFTSNADAIIIDLEDSVAPQAKKQARDIAAGILAERLSARPAAFVRINPLDSGLASDDLAAIMPARPDGLMQPKTNSGKDVAILAEMAGNDIPIIAIATETAASLFNLGTYDGLAANLYGLAWGAEDLSNDLGASGSRTADGALSDPYRLARTLCLAGARAAGVEPIDTVYVDFRDETGLERECRAAARDGFTGKMAIHPAQIDVINQVFTPSEKSIAEAKAIVEAFAASPDAGVLAIDGRMYDIPHLKRARKLLERAAGFSGTGHP